MQLLTSKYSQVVRHLNQESKNTKSIVLLANMVKLQPGELLLILISLLVTIMVLDGLTHTLVTLLGMVYPMFMTFKSIRNDHAEERHKWLGYWLIFGFFTAVDVPMRLLLGWIPWYYPLKSVFLILLIHPKINWAEVGYNKVIKPQAVRLMKYEKIRL